MVFPAEISLSFSVGRPSGSSIMGDNVASTMYPLAFVVSSPHRSAVFKKPVLFVRRECSYATCFPWIWCPSLPEALDCHCQLKSQQHSTAMPMAAFRQHQGTFLKSDNQLSLMRPARSWRVFYLSCPDISFLQALCINARDQITFTKCCVSPKCIFFKCKSLFPSSHSNWLIKALIMLKNTTYPKIYHDPVT